MLLLLSGCGSSGGADTAIVARVESLSTPAIYGGVIDDDTAANGAVVALKITSGGSGPGGGGFGTFELCSGTLIAPNVVLTAHHCVSEQTTNTISCDQHGNSGNGQQLGQDQDPGNIHVYLGAKPDLEQSRPAASGREIFHAQTGTVCNTDLAILVLDRRINDVTPLAVRLESGIGAGETVRAVGYGQNDQSLPIGTRLRKDGLSVLDVGATVTSHQVALGNNEFDLGESICEGDSGGPAISELTGAVLGVVSRGGACTDDFGHIYTSLAGLRNVFNQAFAAAGTSFTEEQSPTQAPSPIGTAPTTGTATPTPAPSSSPPTTPSPAYGPGDLRAGAGNNCSASGAPSAETSAAGGIGLGLVAAFGLLFLRRRRGPGDER